jgi:hypothetical protein
MLNTSILRAKRGKLSILVVAAFLFLLAATSPSLQVSASSQGASNSNTSKVCATNYVATPDGCAPAACVHEISDAGAVISTLSNGNTEVTYSNGSVQVFPACSQGTSSSSPAIDTNGWVETAENVVKTKQMSADFTVPSNPSSNDGQIIYMFPGTQNCVCGSAMIIQPVIQWGNNGAFGGAYWTYASWFVSSSTYTYSTPIRISVGDSLTGTLTKGSCVSKTSCTWKIVGSDATSGKSTKLTYSGIPVQHDDFVTLEVYGVVKCSDYPASGSTTFSGIQVNKGTASSWSPQILQNDGCGENVVVNSGTSITLDY